MFLNCVNRNFFISYFFSFILQFFDASIGMGYGEISVILLLLGFTPLEVVPAIIFTSAIMSIFAGKLHHDFKNVDFNYKSVDFKISTVLTLFGIIGILIGVLIAIRLPENILRLYIGLLVIIIGITILFKRKKKKRYKFSWKKITLFGIIASFNKGITGGGYGPVLAGGQMILGVKSKKAVGITALTEGIVSTVGFIAYYLIGRLIHFNWSLIISLLIGGIIATPVAVYIVKKVNHKILKDIIGVVSILLGLIVVLKVLI